MKKTIDRAELLAERKQKAVKTRKDFVALVEVIMSNINGDPDAGNYPRVDLEGKALVTDMCIKHKIREYVKTLFEDENKSGYRMYIEHGIALQPKQKVAIDKTLESMDKKDVAVTERVIGILCEEFFDIRAFGAALTAVKALKNDAEVRGAVQIAVSSSIDPVNVESMTITRCAPEKEDGGDDVGIKGEKHVISYGLFRIEGHVTPVVAEKTGFSEEDLQILWDAILNMFEIDYAAARGNISTRRLYVFDHEKKLGNARWGNLREKLQISKKEGIIYPNKFEDYDIAIGEMPEGVTLKVFE